MQQNCLAAAGLTPPGPAHSTPPDPLAGLRGRFAGAREGREGEREGRSEVRRCGGERGEQMRDESTEQEGKKE